jgi:threonine dehydratase
LALAARLRGIDACVIIPENTPACKRAAIEAYGARVLKCAASMDAREAAMAAELARRLQEAQPAFVPPYNHPRVIAGQGTIALELLDQAEAELSRRRDASSKDNARRSCLDAVVMPVSGGGMLSGIATVVKAKAPNCLVRECSAAATLLSSRYWQMSHHSPWSRVQFLACCCYAGHAQPLLM